MSFDAARAPEAAPADRLELTDPRAMRALAHPTRLALLEHLHVDGPATATRCGDALGESPAACSYHLRALARWGLVEEAPGGRGRERPWRLRARSIDFSNVGSSEQQAAASLLGGELLRRDERVTREYLEQEAELDAAWRDAATFSTGALFLTVDELNELTAQVRALLQEFWREPADRSPDARRVDHIFRALPRP
jgi:DNA-binding transcriptional ArsR family regulator